MNKKVYILIGMVIGIIIDILVMGLVFRDVVNNNIFVGIIDIVMVFVVCIYLLVKFELYVIED